MDVLDRADLPFPHSLPEFQRLFPDDAACAAYLEKARWGDGFACPHCGTAGEPFHFENRPGVLRCRKCRQNTGLTVGTVMERSHCSTPSAHCSASRATPLLQPMPSFTRESGGTLHVAVMGVNRIGKPRSPMTTNSALPKRECSEGSPSTGRASATDGHVFACTAARICMSYSVRHAQAEDAALSATTAVPTQVVSKRYGCPTALLPLPNRAAENIR